MYKLLIILSLIFLSGSFTTVVAKEKKEIPQYTIEGLKLVPNTKGMALVWAEPGADLSQYDRIHLVEPYVAFKKNWQYEQNRGQDIRRQIRANDMDRIKINVKELFLEVFSEVLEAGGYTLTTEQAEDVLIVKPAIIDLDVKAPEFPTSGTSITHAKSAGSMTLYMELYDSETEDLIAKAMDTVVDRESMLLQWHSSTANRATAISMMKPWAEALRSGLDEARKATQQQVK